MKEGKGGNKMARESNEGMDKKKGWRRVERREG